MRNENSVKHLLKSIIPDPIKNFCKGILSITHSLLLIPKATMLISQIQNLQKVYPSINTAQQLATNFRPNLLGDTKTLDLGCGANIRNPFGAKELFGIDIRSDLSANIKKADLSAEAIPFSSDFFDFCTAFDVLEHIPRISWPNGQARYSFVELMNEIHRILKPGGLFLHSTPAYPSKQVFMDPTHVNIITEDTLPFYFCEPDNWAKEIGYGFHGSFRLVEQGWVDNTWVVGILKAVK